MYFVCIILGKVKVYAELHYCEWFQQSIELISTNVKDKLRFKNHVCEKSNITKTIIICTGL